MEFMAAGWCTGKWLRLYQTIRNLTSGDMGGDLTGINQTEKDQACVPPRPVWGKRGEGAVWVVI